MPRRHAPPPLARFPRSSVTSVPKPFKFLQPHYAPLVTRFGAYAGAAATKCDTRAARARAASRPLPQSRAHPATCRTLFADVLSVLSMTMGAADGRWTLKYKLLGDRSDIGDWGSEYVRSLSGEIGQEYQARVQPAAPADGGPTPPPQPVDDLLGLIGSIIPYNMKHNAEVDVRVPRRRAGIARQQAHPPPARAPA